MRRLWVASAVSAGLVLGNIVPAQAAMSLADGKVNMSLVQTVAKKGKAKETCQYKLIFWCCTPKGGQEYCTIK
jgi:hypothetical protein